MLLSSAGATAALLLVPQLLASGERVGGTDATAGPERVQPTAADPDRPWRLHHPDGSEAGIEDLMDQASTVDVIFLGERHGDPGTHALQLHLLEALIEVADQVGRELILSFEMFDRDVQAVLDEFLADLITEDQFLSVARPWPNYASDYRPTLLRAKEAGLRVLAANTPRRYSDRVSRLGSASLRDLPTEAHRHLPPLPFPEASSAYRSEWEERMDQIAHPHAGEHALEVQALWDASMAFAIHEALGTEAGGTDGGAGRLGRPLVLHLTGSFHVENRTGIPEALRHYRPGIRDLVITAWPVETPEDFDQATAGARLSGLADFLALTPGDRGSGP